MHTIKPSLSDQPNAQITEDVARAPFFLVFDDQKFVKAIKNPFVSGGGA